MLSGVINGKYQILKQFAKGGMSTIYLAQNISDGKLLAVKNVERTGQNNNGNVFQSLSTEGKLLKSLNNRHLPHIYDIIEGATDFTIVMDFIDGKSLEQVIAEDPPSEAAVIDWAIQICEVLTYLHSQQPAIIYRDLKPANLMLSNGSNLFPYGEIKMIDFGTARTFKSESIASGDTVCIGTMGFAAPEQYGGQGQSDARTDIYCLGVTIHNLITGITPPPSPTIKLAPLASVDPQLAKSPLNAIIEKCTKKMASERYQTAEELCADLRIAAQTASTQAKKSSFGQWVRNRSTGLIGREPEPASVSEAAPSRQSSSPVDTTGDALVDRSDSAEAVSEETDWRRIMLAAAILAVSFLILGAVSLVVGAAVLAYVFLAIGAGAAALTIIGAVKYSKQ